MKKILLPVDSLETNTKTMQMAKELVEKFDSDLIILHVIVDINYVAGMRFNNAGFYPAIQEASDKNAKEIVARIKASFEVSGIEAKTVILKGSPANEIVEYAEKEDVDLIIMASNNMETRKRILLGSITNKVVHHCKRPIFVVQ